MVDGDITEDIILPEQENETLVEEKRRCEHDEVKQFSEKLAVLLPNYRIIDDDWESRIVLLKRKDSKYMNIIKRPSEEAHKQNGNNCNGAETCT